MRDERGSFEVRSGKMRKARGEGSFDGAFPALFSSAYRVAFRILGSHEDAEDVAQEAVARSYVRWHRLAGRPEPWVVTVSTNLARNCSGVLSGGSTT